MGGELGAVATDKSGREAVMEGTWSCGEGLSRDANSDGELD